MANASAASARFYNANEAAVLTREDEPRTLIFVDMLGFAELTRRNPTRVLDWGPDEHGFTGSGTTELQSRVVRFHHLIDSVLAAQTHYGGVSAQVFSDCAYIDVTTTVRAVRVAIELMRAAIMVDVPVRIGLGRGTYYSFKYSVESTGTDVVTKALFAGTAVVNAHRAEQCGGKGCRIFLHPSVESDLDTSLLDEPLMPASTNAKRRRQDRGVLPAAGGAGLRNGRSRNRERTVDQDLLTIRHVKEMMEQSEPMDDAVRLHYTETLAAIDRMRQRLNRGTTLEQAAFEEQEINNESDAIGENDVRAKVPRNASGASVIGTIVYFVPYGRQTGSWGGSQER